MSPFRFLKRNLRGRIILLVGLGMVVLAGVLRLSSMWEIREISDRALNERQQLARALADHLDYILKSNLILLQDVALGARVGLGEAALKPMKAALREAYLRSIFTEGVFLLDRTGKMVWIEPQHPSRMHEDFSSLPPIRRALEAGRPEVSDLVVDGKKRIYAVVPIRDWHGELVGVVGGELDPESPRFRSLLHPIRLGDTTYLEIVDDHGIVLASTKAGRAFMKSDHGRFLARLIQEKRPVVGTCHSCHEEEGLPEREREVIAFAPFDLRSLGGEHPPGRKGSTGSSVHAGAAPLVRWLPDDPGGAPLRLGSGQERDEAPWDLDPGRTTDRGRGLGRADPALGRGRGRAAGPIL